MISTFSGKLKKPKKTMLLQIVLKMNSYQGNEIRFTGRISLMQFMGSFDQTCIIFGGSWRKSVLHSIFAWFIVLRDSQLEPIFPRSFSH